MATTNMMDFDVTASYPKDLCLEQAADGCSRQYRMARALKTACFARGAFSNASTKNSTAWRATSGGECADWKPVDLPGAKALFMPTSASS